MSPFWRTNPDRVTGVRLTPVSRQVWGDFLSDCGNPSFYHRWDWLEFIRQEYSLDWHPLGIWRGDTLIGLFPIMVRKLGPFRLAGSPLMQVIASTPFLGPLFASDCLQETVIALEKFSHERHFDHVEIAFPHQLSETATQWLKKQGFTLETCQTIYLHLKNRTPENLWAALGSTCRRAIRKGQKNGVEIMVASDAGFLETYHIMCQEVYQDSGRLPHLSTSFYQNLWAKVYQTGMVYGLLATYQGEMIAGAIFLLHPPYAYYLSGASFKRWQFLRPNNLLQWHFIQWASSQGYEIYDLGGVAHPGITRFKLSFGGDIVPYTRLFGANTSVAHLGRLVYQSAIPLWRRFQAQLAHNRTL